jgi:hypothetical protein
LLGLAARWVNERSSQHISGECFNPSTTGNIRAPIPLYMCRYVRRPAWGDADGVDEEKLNGSVK